mmetsp:Transcript_18230/g.21883  ORF Transcript_18230/g.21883 Transcript_18230/m.21883 type:complete len:94 (+) Transcript_18230:15-296(+)
MNCAADNLADKLIGFGAVEVLTKVLAEASDDEVVIQSAVGAVASLSMSLKGKEAMKEAGTQSALEAVLRRQEYVNHEEIQKQGAVAITQMQQT